MAFGCIDITHYVYLVTVSLILFLMPVVLLSTLSTLFAESRVGKVRAWRLEEDMRSVRNGRHVYCLLAVTVAIAGCSPG